ncbi:MAG: methylmalonyl Co-A mutase-associated GTPase MeaB [Acidimicrobiia bacterium]
MTPPAELARAVRTGDRRALAQAITLVESARADHREQAVTLLEEILAATGAATRVGISGAPGAGKSTFIETLGLHLVEAGQRVAVLAVDPSSARSGGSILGDKTRMEQLSRRSEAFIRPSPSGATVGGVARRTREALLVCEAAGFDVVLVETVGVGQSEVAVAGMVDLFVLLLAPGAGDELQGVKRGIVELADLVVVNKADGDLADLARHTAADYAHALHLVRASDSSAAERVRTCSALFGDGIDELWATVSALVGAARASGELDARRTEQARAWMWSEVTETLLDDLRHDADVRKQIDALEDDVSRGRMSPGAAARQVLAVFRPQ